MAFKDLECVKIAAAEEDIRHRKEDHLIASGWECTTDTPGRRKMWFKRIAGRDYGCKMDNAFWIQDCVDREEYAREHRHEFND